MCSPRRPRRVHQLIRTQNGNRGKQLLTRRAICLEKAQLNCRSQLGEGTVIVLRRLILPVYIPRDPSRIVPSRGGSARDVVLGGGGDLGLAEAGLVVEVFGGVGADGGLEEGFGGGHDGDLVGEIGPCVEHVHPVLFSEGDFD